MDKNDMERAGNDYWEWLGIWPLENDDPDRLGVYHAEVIREGLSNVAAAIRDLAAAVRETGAL